MPLTVNPTIALEVTLGGNYADEAMADDPLVYWRFNEIAFNFSGSSDAEDFTGNEFHATCAAAFTAADLGKTGPLPDGNLSWQFASTKYVQSDSSLIGPTSQPSSIMGTYEMWFYADAGGMGAARTLLSRTGQLHIGLTTGNKVTAGVEGGTQIVSTTTIASGTWYHIAFTMSGGSGRLYVNGVLETGPTAMSFGASSTPFVVGATAVSFANPMIGRIDEVALYLDALSATRVLAHYNASVWTNIIADVRKQRQIAVTYGMRSNLPNDRVAEPGTMAFYLNNTRTNSGRKDGYYSPLHSDCRAGWEMALMCRLRMTYGGTTYTKFIGAIEEIKPDAGTYGRDVRVLVMDWIAELDSAKVEDVDVQINARGDEVARVVIDAIDRKPFAVSLDTFSEEYPYALDVNRDEDMYAREEFDRIAASEFGFFYQKGDGTFRGENRVYRGSNATIALTLERMKSMELVHRRGDVIKKVQALTHQKGADTSLVALFSLVNPQEIPVGTRVSIFGPYKDPNQLAARVGGTDLVSPVATTDYLFNTAEDGTGTNITSQIALENVSLTSNGIRVDIVNNGPFSGYLTFFRVRGKGLYDYQVVAMEAVDTEDLRAYGKNTFSLDMFYQSEMKVGDEIARYILALYKSPRAAAIPKPTFRANASSTYMTAFLTSDISARVSVSESRTGLEDPDDPDEIMGGYFINGVSFTIGEHNAVDVTYVLTPAHSMDFWQLGVAGKSEVGTTTRVAFAFMNS